MRLPTDTLPLPEPQPVAQQLEIAPVQTTHRLEAERYHILIPSVKREPSYLPKLDYVNLRRCVVQYGVLTVDNLSLSAATDSWSRSRRGRREWA